MADNKSDLVDLDLEVLEERPDSFKVTDGTYTTYLPRALVEVEYARGHSAPGPATVTLPQWLAEDRKLV